MSKRNENRPSYKDTKVGWIPTKWCVTYLKDIASINDDYLRDDTLCDQSFYYLTLSDVGNGIFLFPDNMIPYTNAPSRARRIFRKGDILLSMVRPNLKGIGYVNFNCDKFICSTGFAVIRARTNFHAKFLYHFLSSHETDVYFLKRVVGSNYPALNKSDVENMPIIFPPLSEQQKIADILDTWDKAIELVGKQIEAKEKFKKGLMRQLLTGEMRFPGFNEKWELKKLGEAFIERNEKDPTLDLLSITADNGLIQRGDVGRKDTSNDDKSSYKVIMPGDIGYNTMRMWQGRSAVSNLRGIVSPAYTVVTPKEEQCVDFWGYLFKLPQIINLFYRYSQGLVSDTLNLKYSNFSKIKIQFPDYEEQKKIAGLLLNIDDEIKILNKKVITMQIQKQGLMQKLLTGEVRVKV